MSRVLVIRNLTATAPEDVHNLARAVTAMVRNVRSGKLHSVDAKLTSPHPK
jgi:hypothetical protein